MSLYNQLYTKLFSGSNLFICCCILISITLFSACGKEKEEMLSSDGNYSYSFREMVDSQSGLKVVVLTRKGEKTLEARIAPEAGANLFGLSYDGHDLLYSPDTLASLPGVSSGVPILYPTPCRVPGGKFSFRDREFDFGLNRGSAHIHGLVNDRAWEYETPVVDENKVSFRTWVDIGPGEEIYQKFGYEHTLGLTFTLNERGLEIKYALDNRDSQPLPYGLGFHSYFNCREGRENIFLTVPATGRMLMEELIPTGGIIGLEGKYDITTPQRLSGLEMDDVFVGMVPQKPAVIEWRDKGVKLTLEASQEFTHLIVYNPPGRPFFCVENMTCSPDAHNLYAKGFEEASGLKVVPPGGRAEGKVQFVVEEIK